MAEPPTKRTTAEQMAAAFQRKATQVTRFNTFLTDLYHVKDNTTKAFHGLVQVAPFGANLPDQAEARAAKKMYLDRHVPLPYLKDAFNAVFDTFHGLFMSCADHDLEQAAGLDIDGVVIDRVSELATLPFDVMATFSEARFQHLSKKVNDTAKLYADWTKMATTAIENEKARRNTNSCRFPAPGWHGNPFSGPLGSIHIGQAPSVSGDASVLGVSGVGTFDSLFPSFKVPEKWFPTTIIKNILRFLSRRDAQMFVIAAGINPDVLGPYDNPTLYSVATLPGGYQARPSTRPTSVPTFGYPQTLTFRNADTGLFSMCVVPIWFVCNGDTPRSRKVAIYLVPFIPGPHARALWNHVNPETGVCRRNTVIWAPRRLDAFGCPKIVFCEDGNHVQGDVDWRAANIVKLSGNPCFGPDGGVINEITLEMSSRHGTPKTITLMTARRDGDVPVSGRIPGVPDAFWVVRHERESIRLPFRPTPVDLFREEGFESIGEPTGTKILCTLGGVVRNIPSFTPMPLPFDRYSLDVEAIWSPGHGKALILPPEATRIVSDAGDNFYRNRDAQYSLTLADEGDSILAGSGTLLRVACASSGVGVKMITWRLVGVGDSVSPRGNRPERNFALDDEIEQIVGSFLDAPTPAGMAAITTLLGDEISSYLFSRLSTHVLWVLKNAGLVRNTTWERLDYNELAYEPTTGLTLVASAPDAMSRRDQNRRAGGGRSSSHSAWMNTLTGMQWGFRCGKAN
jgi:hypothetical protein